MLRPNILFIHSDQHRWDCVGANGRRHVRTPQMDRLAAEGVNFTHAFTPTAICSPARASLLTGLWPHQHGCMSIPGTELYKPAADGLHTFTQLLNSAGYRLGHVGRFHAEVRGTPLDHGVHEYVPLDQYDGWRAAQGLPPRPAGSGFLGYFGGRDPHVTPEQSPPGWGASQAIEMLSRFAASDQPFFLRWDTVEPHLPCVPCEPFASMYQPEALEPWPSFDDALVGKPFIQAQQRRHWRVEGWTWDDWAPTVAAYLGEISLLDSQIGRLLDELDRLGVADRTVVIYSTDHGDLCGGHGMMDKHFVMYDDVMRVPLIMRVPPAVDSRIGQGVMCDAFVTHELDLASTFLDLAAADTPDQFLGRSLLAVAGGRDPQPRDAVFGSWHGGQFGSFSQRMIRDRQFKYVWNCTAEDELYDPRSDPGELRNRAADPALAGELQRLRARLVAWMDATRDPVCNPWTRPLLLADPMD